MSIEKKEKTLHDELTILFNSGRIPVKKYPRGSEFKRWQGKAEKTGVYYGKPSIEHMGRYNDPTGKTGVCYMSELAVVAIAESYGRRNQQGSSSEPIHILRSSLDVHQICTLSADKELITVDIIRLIPLLHLTTDIISSDDYSLTNDIVGIIANDFKGSYDGISYQSRHLSLNHCLALFEQEVQQVSTLRMEPMSQYRDSEYLPDNWEYDDIDAEEILDVVLNLKVSMF